MKKDIHPKYQPIIFHDVSCNKSFLISSTLNPKEKMVYEDGKEYPLYKLDISHKSHPYFTGQQNLVDSAGRIEKYMKKYNLDSKQPKD